MAMLSEQHRHLLVSEPGYHPVNPPGITQANSDYFTLLGF